VREGRNGATRPGRSRKSSEAAVPCVTQSILREQRAARSCGWSEQLGTQVSGGQRANGSSS
jgi:hypothetical protein